MIKKSEYATKYVFWERGVTKVNPILRTRIFRGDELID